MSLNLEQLFKVVSRSSHSRPKRDEPPAKYIARQTHLHLNGRKLKECSLPSGATPQLRALYLFDNDIERLDVGPMLPTLTNLYAYNNQISSVGDLSSLGRLQKLYLSHNRLQSLAALAPLQSLVELDASSQVLPPGEAFDISGEALANMRYLRTLKLANNGLTSTAELAGCRRLETVGSAPLGL